MKKIFKLNESDIHNIVSIVLEQDEKEWVKVTPERYIELMKLASYYAKGIASLPEFRGKNIWITGNLNLSGTPTKSLDGIKRVDGKLDIQNTGISSIEGIDVKGYVSDWGTPLRAIRDRKIKDKKIADANMRREDDEWNLDSGYGKDDVAYSAHAILESIIDNNRGKIQKMTDKDSSRLVELNELLDNLRQKETEYEEQDRDLTDVHADIEVAEEEIEEIGNKMDVYHLIPDGNHYDLPKFEVVGVDEVEGEVYCAGTPEQMEDAAYEYVKETVRSEGYDFFNRNFVESYIDEDEVVDYFRDYYENDIRDNPDVYFNDDDYQLTDEQQTRIDEIDVEIAELEEKQNNLEHEIEEPSDYSRAYDEVQEEIDMLEDEKNDIEPEVGEPTEDMIEEKLDDMLESVRRDPAGSLRDLGIDNLDNFINEDDFIRGVVEADGIGVINSYDGEYDSVYVNGEEYYVMRIE